RTRLRRRRIDHRGRPRQGARRDHDDRQLQVSLTLEFAERGGPPTLGGPPLMLRRGGVASLGAQGPVAPRLCRTEPGRATFVVTAPRRNGRFGRITSAR